MARPLTTIEKIIKNHLSPGSRVGGIVSLTPKHVMTHDNTFAVMPKFSEIWKKSGKNEQIFNSSQPVFTLDHNIQDNTPKNLEKYSKIAEFAKKHSILNYPAGRGIGHQVMIEEGFISPGSIVVASDSHSNMYGGLGCLGTPVVRSDAASIWCTGRTWWQVPPIARVEISGKLSKGVSGKDVILALCGSFKKDEVLNCAVEFVGEGVGNLSVEERLTIANMTTEWGSIAGVFPVDDVCAEWIEQRVKENKGQHPRWNEEMLKNTEISMTSLLPDENAPYYRHLTLDLSSVTPLVTGPNSVKITTPISELEKQKISVNKAYLLSCVNSRASDLATAAKILEGKTIHPEVKMYVAAASSKVQAEAEEKGDWGSLLSAGALPLPPGCGPCIGLGVGLLEDGEVGISATNRNFRGRMGSRDAQAYLGSPEVVAMSALNGYICGPKTPLVELKYDFVEKRREGEGEGEGEGEKEGEEEGVNLHPQFPEEIKGTVIFCDADNINTDGIYPGVYTYKELTLDEQSKVAMENYDEKFLSLLQKGDILVSGANFGSGSSREQAATALLAAGIKVVIASSFSETFKRNAWNNGLIVLEAPSLVKVLRSQEKNGEKTVRGGEIHLNFVKRKMKHLQTGAEVRMDPIGEIGQELIVHGGLVPWASQELTKKD